MVRLVFRPYTQLRRSICTSESLRTSIRVSPDFILAGHSSPSFGYQRARYRCAPVRRRPTAAPEGTTVRNAAGPLGRPGNADDRPRAERAERELGNRHLPLKFTFIAPFVKRDGFRIVTNGRRRPRERTPPTARHPATRAHVRLLGPCFKTGRKEARRFVADR